MSRDASLLLDWADGTYTFRIAIGQWRELQEKTGVGPLELYRRVSTGAWRIDDLCQTIRLGLIGGGLAPAQALALSRSYVEQRPPLECVLTAEAVLLAGLMGSPEEGRDQKKSDAASVPSESPSATDDSASPTSMASVEP